MSRAAPARGTTHMKRILIADDSPLAREILTRIVNDDPEMTVVGVATNGKDTIRRAEELKPDLIMMDLLMPDMNGVEATRRVMAVAPTPIVLISSAITSTYSSTHFDALSVGAVDVLEKPHFATLMEDGNLRRRFLDNLKAMSEVVTVTRRGRGNERETGRPRGTSPTARSAGARRNDGNARAPETAKLIVVGASTGGPPALAKVLSKLDPTASPPVVVVQHIAVGFISGFVEWLNQATPARVQLAEGGARLLPGNVYVAPDGHHVEVTPYSRLLVSAGLPLRFHRPSVDVLFGSAAANFGSTAIGVLLTGMGDDGARGLASMHAAGAFTVAQDKETSLVYGMPAAAVDRGAVRLTATCPDIADTLHAVRLEAFETRGFGP
jgi:two-component system chemotaxis response regulator CheB